MSQAALESECPIGPLAEGEERDGETSQQTLAALLVKNRENAFRFLKTPYSARALFLPQCLRSSHACQADQRGAEYICKRCGACKIADIARLADELGYISVKVLKGGSALRKLVRETRARAVLGVSCPVEGIMGIAACERAGVAAFCVPLLRAGCADTDVDLEDVKSALEAALP